MANPEHVAILQQGVEAWNSWRRLPKAPTLIDVSGFNFTGVHDLTDYDLSGVHVEGAVFSNANMTRINFHKAHLMKANFEGAVCEGCIFSGADLRSASLQRGQFPGTNFRGANLAESHLANANFTKADFRGSDLSFADINTANLSHITVGDETRLSNVRVGTLDPPCREREQTVVLGRRDFISNWSRLRTIGRFPFFTVSWAAFVISLLVVNMIGFLNHQELLDFIDYPIPIPERMGWIIFSSVLLIAGSTLYHVYCPQRVQHFSETTWVEEHKNSRLHYLGEMLRRRRLQETTAVLFWSGALIAVMLTWERLVAAAVYILF